jgi:hypothetical protein
MGRTWRSGCGMDGNAGRVGRLEFGRGVAGPQRRFVGVGCADRVVSGLGCVASGTPSAGRLGSAMGAPPVRPRRIASSAATVEMVALGALASATLFDMKIIY